MPPALRAQSIAAAEPTRAAHQTASAVLGDAPRARPLLLAVASWGAHPGLRPSPWVLDGVLRAVKDGGLGGGSVVLGDPGGPGSLTDRLAAGGLPATEEPGTALGLRPPGSHRELRVPRSWVGRSLCLVLPCVHRQAESRSGRPTWNGPIGTALLALARRFGGTASLDPTARCLSELFAHISVIIDASWWAPLSAEDQGAPLLLAPERTLGLRLASPVTEETFDPRTADAWIGHWVGLPIRHPTGAPRLEGPAARTPWPKVPRLPAARRRPGLAGQAVSALWRRTDRTSPRRAALPPSAPGALARLWDEYDGARPG